MNLVEYGVTLQVVVVDGNIATLNHRDQESKQIDKFFADKTLNRNCYSGSTHAKVPLSEEKTIPAQSTTPYKLQYEYRIEDQGWGNPTYGYLILKNNTTGKEHTLKSSSSKRRRDSMWGG